jgi:hypothetical protein
MQDNQEKERSTDEIQPAYKRVQEKSSRGSECRFLLSVVCF